MICFNFFKGCLPQILIGPFLNALTHFKEAFRQLKSNHFQVFVRLTGWRTGWRIDHGCHYVHSIHSQPEALGYTDS